MANKVQKFGSGKCSSRGGWNLKDLDIMTQNTAATAPARRFSPIFVATITPAAIEVREGKNGAYAYMQGSTVTQEGRESKTMTVMAFGKSHSEVADLLNPGSPVDLAVPYDGGRTEDQTAEPQSL